MAERVGFTSRGRKRSFRGRTGKGVTLCYLLKINDLIYSTIRHVEQILVLTRPGKSENQPDLVARGISSSKLEVAGRIQERSLRTHDTGRLAIFHGTGRVLGSPSSATQTPRPGRPAGACDYPACLPTVLPAKTSIRSEHPPELRGFSDYACLQN